MSEAAARRLVTVETAEPLDEPTELSEPCDVFMARVGSAGRPCMLVEDLVPEDGITMFHGQPRDGKSLAMLEVLLAIATGTPAFGLPRLAVREPAPVLYIGEEDSPRRVYERLVWLLHGRGLEAFQHNLRLCVRRGTDFDDPRCQDALTADAQRNGIRFVAIDPMRGVTARADQGPAELKPFVAFLRTFMRETRCVVGLVHHDTKPVPGKPDERRRPQRASGGGIFSIADAPVSFERLSSRRVLMAPTGYKFGDDPPPLIYTIDADNPTTRMRLVGEEATASTAEEAALHEAVLAFLKENPGASGSGVVKGLRKSKDLVLRTLHELEEGGELDSFEQGPGRPTQWFLRGSRAS